MGGTIQEQGRNPVQWKPQESIRVRLAKSPSNAGYGAYTGHIL